jgi:hypothetical protein
MKRSEMVKKIATKIVSFKGDLPPSRNDEFVASATLRTLEELGMKPPPYTKTEMREEWEVDNRHRDGGFVRNKPVEITRFEWEAE